MLAGAHAFAPPLDRRVEGTTMIVDGVFGAPYEGPAGLVHGGWLAAVFDELLGMQNVQLGLQALTGTIEVHYVAPTPLHRFVRIVVEHEGQDGRRMRNTARCIVDDVVTAVAVGIFVTTDV